MVTTPTVWKSLFKVNVNDAPGIGSHANATNTQSTSVSAALSTGGLVVAWEDSSTNLSGLEPRDILGRTFDFLFTTSSSDLYLSSVYQDLDQQAPSIAGLPNGGFVSAYQTTDAAGAGDLENITAQWFDAGQMFSSGSVDLREGFGAPSVHNDTTPAITAFADGSYVIVYQSDAAGNRDLVAQSVAANGTEGAVVTIESTSFEAGTPQLATLTSDNYAVTYAIDDRIEFTVRTKAGAFVAGGTVGSGSVGQPDIAALTSGGFVVTWQDADADGAGNAGVRARAYNAAGTPAGVSFVVPTTRTGTQHQTSVAALKDGGFLVVWHDAPTTSVMGQRYSAAGAMVGTEFVVGAVPGAAASDPDATLLADGRVAVSMTVNASGNEDVYAVILDPRDSVTGSSGNDQLTSRVDGALVSGLGGTDRLVGFLGADTLDGGAGNDTMEGGAGDDVYYVDSVSDVVTELAGQGTADKIMVGQTWSGVAANVEIVQLLDGGNYDLTGSTRADILRGNAQTNTILGGVGADTIIGGGGKDLMTGGAGLDVMRLESLSDSGAAFATRDVINTFAHGDKVDLSMIDANSGLAGDQAFTFSATRTAGLAGQLVWSLTNISSTGVKGYLVSGYTNTDAVADFTLQIYTAPTPDRTGQPQTWNLASWDFIL